MSPGTTYIFSLYTDKNDELPIANIRTVTPVVSKKSVRDLMKRVDRDMRLLLPSSIESIREAISESMTTGQNITLSSGEKAFFVQNYGNISLGKSVSTSILTPFSKEEGSGQNVDIGIP